MAAEVSWSKNPVLSPKKYKTRTFCAEKRNENAEIETSHSMTMMKIPALLSLLAACTAPVAAYNAKSSSGLAATKLASANEAAISGRRGFLNSAATAASLAFGVPVASLIASPQPASANVGDLTDVYFGVGCFWHIQVRLWAHCFR